MKLPAARPARPLRNPPFRPLARYKSAAQQRLRRFQHSSRLAVAVTAFFLLFQDALLPRPGAAQTSEESVEQAASTLRELFDASYTLLPKIGIALAVLVLGWLASRSIKWLFSRFLHHSQRARTVLAFTQLGLFFVTFVAAVSLIVGDFRALLGSLGLLGLALSWALQAPIESFTGWVLNMLRGYYRVGDRIEVGTVLGDVYQIDILTTTVWEIGRPGKAVEGAQPTGALTTFPNSELLRSSIINYTRDFDYVWDELTIGLANETDVSYSLSLFRQVSEDVLSQEMVPAVQRYQKLLARAHLSWGIEDKPQLYLSLTDSFINCTIRYLVPIRARRKTASELLEALLRAAADPAHRDKVIGAYPRQEILLRSQKAMSSSSS